MDCREVERFVQLRLDEEIEPSDCLQLDLHLEQCPRCRDHAAEEQRYQSLLKSRLRDACTNGPPKSLRDRIQIEIHREADAARFPYGRAVAASIAALILTGLGLGWGARNSGSSRLYEETVAKHSSNLPPDFRPVREGPEEVHRFLEKNLRYSVAVPQPRADFPVRLVGARLSNIRDHDAAYVIYDHRGAKLSLFAHPHTEPLDLEGFERRSVGGRELYVGRTRGYNVVTWKDRDLLYSLVSDVDPSELVQLASTMR